MNPDEPCWCNRDHRETRSDNPYRNFDNAATSLGHAYLGALRIPQVVAALDRFLRRWPWLYRRLGGDD